MIISDGSNLIKPALWAIDPGVVACNAQAMGLPMPAAIWPMWEGSGGILRDIGGNNQDGTFSGPVWKYGGIEFDGVDDKITCISTNLNLNNADSSWVFVAKLYSDAPDECAFGGFRDAFNKMLVFNERDGSLEIQTNSGGAFGIISVVYDEYAFYAAVFDNSADEATVYVNLTSNTVSVTFDNDIVANTPFQLGRQATYDEFYGVQQIAIYFNEKLSSTQISTLYADPYGLVREPEMGLWLYDTPAAGGLSIPVAMHHYMHQ